jgi:hypothetical protein
MKRFAAITALFAIGLMLSPASAQTPSLFPTIDVRVPVPPQQLVGGGATHLVYELHIANLSTAPTTLDAVEVRDRSAGPNAPALLRLEGETLRAALWRAGAPPDDSDRQVLPPGRPSVVFVWLTLPAGAVPSALTHRFATAVAVPGTSGQGAGETAEQPVIVEGVEQLVSLTDPRVIGPPVEGDHWLAANGPDNGSDHRRALLALSGQARIAQRFAIDWVRLYDSGRTFEGDPSKNESYRAFGASVIAVADGTVAAIRDGIPENQPGAKTRAVPMTPDTLAGNSILLDLGGGAYAFYGHLQPGSLRAKKGDAVRRGQVLAQVGNTGNSSEPHLHFHVSDRASGLDSEGIPYALESFEVEAPPAVITPGIVPVGTSLGLNPAALSSWETASPERHGREIPLRNAIVSLSAR